jgi:phage recombination protein Bet
MSTQAQPPATQKKSSEPSKPSALSLMASRLSCDPIKLHATLKATVFKNATEEELMALVLVSNEYQLNPLLKEIYAFPAKGGGICPIVSVDGWNKMLIRQENFDGIKFEFEEDPDRAPITCTATVFLKNRSHPLSITEYFSECARGTDNWKNMPHRMLRNRTLCQVARLAFGFAGVYNEDEAATITVDTTVTPVGPPPKMVAAPTANTPQQDVEAIINGEGFTYDDLKKVGMDTGIFPDADTFAGFSEIPAETCKRLIRAKAGLINSLKGLTNQT